MDLLAEASQTIVMVKATGNWQLSSTLEWVEVSPSSGTGNAQVNLKTLANSGTAARKGELIITSGSLSKTLYINQDGRDYPDYYSPPNKEGMREITSLDMASQLGIGWNLGNSLEAIGGETAWGNPRVSPAMIAAVKAAGFSTVRIPVAWSRFTNASQYTIDPAWMARVEEVVGYVLDQEMNVILNMHWDGGWMQPTFAEQAEVNKRLEKMWIQIALHFRDYNDQLLFAGSNEVMVEGDYSTPKAENITVQNGFNQTFVNAIRSTGGRNTYRHLLVQAYNTNIDYAVAHLQLPEDTTEDRLMVEVHYYDPYEFALKETNEVLQWGKNATDSKQTAGWGEEEHAIHQFKKLKQTYVDKGVPVIIGEFGAIAKLDNSAHHEFRTYYIETIVQQMLNHDLVPIYWDNGHTGNYGFGLFDRDQAKTLYPAMIYSLTKH